ncbi:hypothetical protein [Scytonema sp. NUACC21]
MEYFFLSRIVKIDSSKLNAWSLVIGHGSLVVGSGSLVVGHLSLVLDINKGQRTFDK